MLRQHDALMPGPPASSWRATVPTLIRRALRGQVRGQVSRLAVFSRIAYVTDHRIEMWRRLKRLQVGRSFPCCSGLHGDRKQGTKVTVGECWAHRPDTWAARTQHQDMSCPREAPRPAPCPSSSMTAAASQAHRSGLPPRLLHRSGSAKESASLTSPPGDADALGPRSTTQKGLLASSNTSCFRILGTYLLLIPVVSRKEVQNHHLNLVTPLCRGNIGEATVICLSGHRCAGKLHLPQSFPFTTDP